MDDELITIDALCEKAETFAVDGQTAVILNKVSANTLLNDILAKILFEDEKERILKLIRNIKNGSII